MLNLNVPYLEGPEGEEPKGMPNPFPSHFPSQIPLPSAQIPFTRAEFRKILVFCIQALFSSHPQYYGF